MANKGIGIAISVMNNKAQMKIRNNGCSISDLNSAIVYLELAKMDLIEQLKKITKKQK